MYGRFPYSESMNREGYMQQKAIENGFLLRLVSMDF